MKRKNEKTFLLFLPVLFALLLFVFVSFTSTAGHEHIYFDEVIFPTCTERGFTKHTCTVCGESFSDSFVRENGHDAVVKKAVGATCTEKGKTEGMYCSVCGKILKGLEEIEPLGHQMVSDKNSVKPTCTSSGKTASEHCKRCNFILPSKTLSPLGHEIIKDPPKEPTCTKQGKTEGEHCSRCDYKIAQKSIPAFGHSLVIDSAVKATCTKSGLSSGKHCTKCDYAEPQDTIAPLGHNIIKTEEKKATCTSTGLTKGEYCTRCNFITGQKTIPSLGHALVIDPAVKATCTKSGLTEGKHCTRCDYRLAQNTVVPLGHNIIKDKAEEPTCTKKGKTEGEHCSRCDYKIAQKTVPSLGHALVIDSAVKATCTKSGLTEGKHCTRCDYRLAQNTVAPLGHNIIKDKAEESTCTKKGKTEGEHCSRCDYKIAQKTIPSLGHALVIDSAVKATCTKSGLTEGKHCTRCDYRLAQNTVAPLGHNIIKDKAEEPTCTKKGKTEGEHCSRCDYKIAQKQTPEKPHRFEKYVVKATFSKDGYVAERCSLCKTFGKKKSVISAVSSAVLSKKETVYNGKAQTPAFVVKDKNGKTLKEKEAYTVSFFENINVGKAYAKLTLKGNYSGTKTLSFRILPPAVKKLSVTRKTTEATVKWSKAIGANGYKVSLFKNGKCIKTVDTEKAFAVFKNLKSAADYKVTVKAYALFGKTKAVSKAEKSLSFSTKPERPNLAVKSGNGFAVLSWNAVPGAQSYTVFYSQGKNGKLKKLTVKKNAVKIKNLAHKKVYFFKVCANKKSEGGVLSSEFATKSVKIG